MFNRKRGLSGCAALIMAAMLVACGGNRTGDGISPEKQSAASAKQAESEQQATAGSVPTVRTVKHKMGETNVPASPQRVVADQYMGHLMALGIKPVGVRTALLESYHLKDRLAGIADAGAPFMNVEKVLDLKPDLIVSQNEKGYEDMSKIAPTIVFPYGQTNAMEQLRILGDAVGKRTEADRWIAAYEEKAKQYRQQLNGIIKPGETVSIVEVWAKTIYVYGNNWGRGGYSLYNSLQLKPPLRVINEVIDKEKYAEISMELLPEYAGDYIFLTVYGANGGSERAEEIKKSAIWRNLPAVKNNRVIPLDIAVMFDGDPISIEKQMDLQVKSLLSFK
ncbi:ABC transporter substrate-binding protein [Paenibacillus hemerocallicola]|uniref:ABC transporter substrate-binding protein n=1 Tax=Paenibacillus hemerocallicola TaxID=1172614 RepID=A0A5C4T5W4_9BACL|nr:ABC transporter substrate-binding protein [Paenibacillus hemerocallicola]TNJ64453.1 ABC transporter substrate-binding protein [Paenibacillus hemerocallicola]